MKLDKRSTRERDRVNCRSEDKQSRSKLVDREKEVDRVGTKDQDQG